MSPECRWRGGAANPKPTALSHSPPKTSRLRRCAAGGAYIRIVANMGKSMLSEAQYPVAWASFICELSDAQEHLGELLAKLAGGSIDAETFRVDIGHVYAHLNRAWYQSKSTSEISDAEWGAATAFPQDITPVG